MVSVQVVYVISLDRMVQKHAAKSKQNHILINEKIKTDIIYKSHNKGGEAKMITKDDRAYKTEASFGFFDVINVLGNDFSNIYSVDCESQNVEIYRYDNQSVGVKEALQEKCPYKTAVQKYIEFDVFTADKKKMQVAMDFDRICARLREVPHFTVHYRVKRNGRIQYFYMKCVRSGSADDFQRVVFAFANEDADVRLSELEKIVKSDIATGRRKILIVEDNQLDREMLSSMLQDKYEILTAANGESGFTMLENNYKTLSLILLDVRMPICDGFEFLKRMQEDPLLSSVPTIVLTASDEPDAELTCLTLGANDFIRKPYNAEIVKRRISNVIQLKASVLALNAVEHDQLTGMYTEQAFRHYAQMIMTYKPDMPMHLVIAKIRDFKLLNSIYGMKKMDEVLCYLASVYSAEIEHGILARKGSSSFVCMFWGDNEVYRRKLEDVINQIAERSPINGLKVKYGIYTNIDKSLSISTICDYAAMAQETITDSYDCDLAYYTEEMAQKWIRSQKIENSFESALNKQEFVVYYQPKIDIVTEKIIGAEALVRWKTEQGTMISPGEFIPVYEKDGLIVRLDEYVFRHVCSLQRSRMEQGKKILPISVNLSRTSTLHREIAERYFQIVKENGIPCSSVPIELTESAATYNDRIRATTEQLAKAGFSLHMDDFGAGYSSLTSLNRFPFSTLKIDKSLIDHVCQKKGRTLVEQVITLAKLLNMTVVAEGVENKEELEVLKELKCDEVQGFYYARPMPEDEFVQYVNEN